MTHDSKLRRIGARVAIESRMAQIPDGALSHMLTNIRDRSSQLYLRLNAESLRRQRKPLLRTVTLEAGPL